MGAELFTLTDVGITKQEQRILQQVSLTITEGTVLAIAGPSGAGKSSLLRLLNRLHSPTEGAIFFRGQSLADLDPVALRRQVGYVPQKPYLFGLTVVENLCYPFQLRGLPCDRNAIISYLERVKLPAGVLEKRCGELSGGEQQRVCLIRALLAQPTVLLLDEATASLDETNTAVIENFVAEEQARRQMTVVFVSHQREQLRRLARQVVGLREGRVQYQGDAAGYLAMAGGENGE